MRRLFLTASVFALCGCGEFNELAHPNLPKSQGENYSGYSYVPLDPMPVATHVHPNCKGKELGSLYKHLPDNAVRIAMRQLTANGSLGFVPVSLGYQGSSYQVVLDFINADVTYARLRQNGGDLRRGSTPYSLDRIDDFFGQIRTSPQEIVIPVYVGIGLRLTANVTVHSGHVNLSSLGALSAAADAKKITGSLIVQTLGITGPKVIAALPLPSDLNATTIQNAILSLGTVKALMDGKNQDVDVFPRVIGIYYPFPNPSQYAINVIVTALARDRVPFWKSCPVVEPEEYPAGYPAPVAGYPPPPPPPPPPAPERGL